MDYIVLLLLLIPIALFLFPMPRRKLPLTKYALHKQPAFWYATLTPIWWSLSLSIPLMSSNFGMWQFDSEGYSNFVADFGFPISLLSLSVVFGVVIARFHGSQQKEKQLIETEKRNQFQYYYEHKKDVINQIQEEFGKVTLNSEQKRHISDFTYGIRFEHIYHFAFPENRIGSETIGVLAGSSTRNNLIRELKDIELKIISTQKSLIFTTEDSLFYSFCAQQTAIVNRLATENYIFNFHKDFIDKLILAIDVTLRQQD